jgi:aryl-alcohol dehydrogenase-like predicted oxidoreductase
MDYRVLGRTGLRVSVLGFGCGNVGGLLIRGTPAEREQAVARALELGINYFDTAVAYGDGVSERHIGQALRPFKSGWALGTKFRVDPGERDVAGAVARSLDGSLQRLGLERVDLLQLHNAIGAPRGLAARVVLDEVVPALERLREAGKVRFYGITANGEPGAIHEVIESGLVDTAQVFYNLLNPSAGRDVPADFPGVNFRRLLQRAHARGVGVISVRMLAAGALSGASERHPVAVPSVEPIASGPDYETDVRRAQRLQFLVDEGHAKSLVEAALRFVAGTPEVSTALLGYSSLEHLETAAASVARGPLPAPALARLGEAWATFAK